MAKKAKVKPSGVTYYHNSDEDSVREAQEFKKKNPNARLVQDDTTNHKASGIGANLGGAGMSASARLGQIGPDLIGANLGQLSHQVDAVEQSQMVDKIRKSAKESLSKKKKLQGEVSLGPTTVQRYTEKPIPGGLNEPVDAKTKKKIKVQKKS